MEFDIDLVKIALNNKKILNADNVNFIHEDASNYILPNENSIIFMFNPFDEIILKKFLVNNIRHFKHFNSILMYANDIHRDQLIEMGFSTAFRNAKRSISLYKYTAN